MAVQIDQIRERASRVAESHGLEVVDVEMQGSGKQRVLRVFVEKDAAGRTADDEKTARDPDGTVLDVEDLVPGAEYTLEVSSPGLERKLSRPEEFGRFLGSLVKVQTFTPVSGNRHWKGRMTQLAGDVLTVDLSAIKQKGKARKAAAAAAETIEISLRNVEKANLVAEF